MSEIAIRRSTGFDRSALLEYLPRLCRWRALVVAIVASWGVTWWQAADVTTESAAVWLVRVAVVIGALGGVFALDDPSRDVTEAAVGARRRLMPGRLALVFATTTLSVIPALVVTREHLSENVLLGLGVEAVSMIVLMCAVTLTLQRQWRMAEPAQFVVFSVLVVAVADRISAGRWPLLVPPGPGWEDAHRRWVALGVVLLLVCLWQLRDPASRRPFSLPRRTSAKR